MRRGREGRGIVCAPFRDKQQDAPREECPGCGQEQYWYDPPAREGLCPACRRRVREREENAMTLQEMSKEYRAQAQVLRGRINELKAARAKSEQAWEKDALSGRIGILETLWREARDQAVLLEHYYDRGYRRNGHYTL